ncbi:MAG: DoxX family protein, partial [Dehalococcoidia bacterium]
MIVMMSRTNRSSMQRTSRTHVALWVAQALLAATFIFAGIAKLAMSSADLEDAVPLPVLFMRFIALAELFGGLG